MKYDTLKDAYTYMQTHFHLGHIKTVGFGKYQLTSARILDTNHLVISVNSGEKQAILNENEKSICVIKWAEKRNIDWRSIGDDDIDMLQFEIDLMIGK